MEYTSYYVKHILDSKQAQHQINKVRLSKRVYLPFELVGINSGQATNTYVNNSEVSTVEWRFYQNELPSKITPKEYKIQNNLKWWLKQQLIITVMDF